MKKLLAGLLFIASFAIAQKSEVFVLDSIPKKVEQVWRFNKGDKPEWANPNFNDSLWQKTRSNFSLAKIPKGSFDNIAWFRLRIMVDSSLANKTLGLSINQAGASEIYLDGKLLHSIGTINTKDPDKEEHISLGELPLDIRFNSPGQHLIAVRYANNRAQSDFEADPDDFPGFSIKFITLKENLITRYTNANIVSGIFAFYFAFFLALSFLHFMLFRYYTANKSNLYYGIFNLAFGSTFLWLVIQQVSIEPDTIQAFRSFGGILPNIYAPALLAMLYTIFYKRIPKFFWIFFAMYFTDLLFTIIGKNIPYLGVINLVLMVVESFRMVIVAIIRKLDGAWIIGTGILATLVFFTTYGVLAALGLNFTYQADGLAGALFGITVILATLSIPLSMTVYLARDFARLNKSLQKKLIEVEDLSAKSIEQEKEKQAILANQNEVLEHQVKERTAEIVEQKKVIEEKNKDITDSITYAKRLQQAILPSNAEIKKHLPESFLFYKPKDIVAGDFYWMHVDDKYVFIAAADCTGHGVPGAMVSVVCSNALNRAVNEFNLTDTGKILDKTRELVIETFEKSESEVKDGMDISLLRIERNKNGNEIKVQWSGANNSLFYIENNEALPSRTSGSISRDSGTDELNMLPEVLEGNITEVKADKQPIGKYGEANPFTSHDLAFSAAVSFYLFSDGYADQFSEGNKKLLKKKFKEQLISVQGKSLQEQGAYIEKCHYDWKGNMEQTDDVLVIGVRLKN